MKNRTLFIAGGVMAFTIVGYAAWYLASPLFINDIVDEAFPLETSSQEVLPVTDEENKEMMEAAATEAISLTEEGATPAMAEEEVETAEVVMPDKTMEEAIPEAAGEPVALVSGEFMDADSFHMSSGTATIFQLPDGRFILRFENFEATNGPDLHVVLSEHPNPSNHDELGANYLDLGSLKGNIGNQNYEIPSGMDLSAYKSVVIYCQPFQVVFATATLN